MSGLFCLLAIQPSLAQRHVDSMVVAVVGGEPFVVDTVQKTGVSLEIWDLAATELSIPYKTIYFKEVPEAIQSLEAGKVQAIVGPVSITSARAEKMQFTQPYYQTGLSILSPATPPSLWSRIAPFFSRRFFIAVFAFIGILAIVGTFLWVAERKANPHQFSPRPARGIADGMWCAIATMTTTGYGDVTPKTFWGRFAASAWMVISLVFGASMVAGIASVLTISGFQSNTLNTPDQLKGKMVAVIAGSVAQGFVSENGGAARVVDNLDQAKELLKRKEVVAIVDDRPQLLYYLMQHPDPDYANSQGSYQKEGYGFAFAKKSTDVQRFNIALLKLSELGVIDKILVKWLGAARH